MTGTIFLVSVFCDRGLSPQLGINTGKWYRINSLHTGISPDKVWMESVFESG